MNAKFNLIEDYLEAGRAWAIIDYPSYFVTDDNRIYRQAYINSIGRRIKSKWIYTFKGHKGYWQA